MLKPTNWNTSIKILIAFAFLFAFAGNAEAVTHYSTLTLDIEGLEDLGDNAMYEGWVIVEGSPVSTGLFSVDENGMLSQTHFLVEEEALNNAEKFVLTIEPYPDDDPAPSATHILAGSFDHDEAVLSIDDPAALGNDFSLSAGNYILATPTNGPETNENSGIWFLDLTSGMPDQGLFIPVLPEGWKYEGWVVMDGIPVTTGTFLDPTMADEEAPYSGSEPGPPFPGEDFLQNPPPGLTFPTDIAGATAVLSIEPYPDNSDAPFTLKPLVGMIPPDAEDHVTYAMGQNLESFPTGFVMRGEGDLSVDMVPEAEPLTVPAGGMFTYTGILFNNVSEYMNPDVWIMVDIPDYGLYGPVMVYWDVMLYPNQIVGITDIMQYIPSFAPVGDYRYIAACGDYPDMMVDMVSFDFTVSNPLRGEDVDNWNLYGWFDDEDAGNSSAIPTKTALLDNYPNPFNAQTNINVELAQSGDISLDVYNLMGQKVATLADGYTQAGSHTFTWDASNSSSGVYFYKLNVGGEVLTKRMTLLK
ncbi:MAG: T9SS type A sorting domain-containing protein [candidate division Zixibacteria bacterium]|nr:T9SS type A sorting domain-containing protein [candidate division Zixibacteria bacterium]